MSYSNVIVFDDDKDFTEKFSKLLTEDGFSVFPINDAEELSKILDDPSVMNDAAAVIFDLAQSDKEEQTAKNFKITEKIQQNFDKWRIPIFIHSGFADKYEHFKDCGTVWKKEKSGTSIEEVCDIIKMLSESGFNDVFGAGGDFESTILSDLHNSFIGQFKNGEIEKIINAYSTKDAGETKTRLGSIFKRIATKSFVSELVTPDVIVNPLEVYYRRTSKLDFWTGDLFSKNDGSELIMIMTPRCNVASKGVSNLLVCVVENDFPTTKKDLIKRALTDNPDYSGNAFRYLPPSPIFGGGRVNLANHKTLSKDEINNNYKRILTLSDDITNEILAKFSSYFLRTGINAINVEEVVAYFESMKEPDASKK